LLCATSSTDASSSSEFIAAVTSSTTRGQKGASALATSSSDGTTLAKPPRAKSIGDGSPRQRTDGRAVHQHELGLRPLIFTVSGTSAN
jgi:hypothetical protein